jgi:regulator of nucleoside diphosphate kinase
MECYMRGSNLSERKLTELDFRRLHRFTAAGAMPLLLDLLNEADVVPATAIPADVVTMYAQFVIRDLKMQRRQILVLCYPADAEPGKGYVSVLSPAGMALIGLQVGALGRWTGAGGEESVAQVEGILFQPEASGDYVTHRAGIRPTNAPQSGEGARGSAKPVEIGARTRPCDNHSGQENHAGA